MIERQALVLSSEIADQPDGVFCLSVDNPATFEFQPLNCTHEEFVEWYLIKLGRVDSELAEYRVDGDRHEIWLWVDEHGVVEGDVITITSEDVFLRRLDFRIEEARCAIGRMVQQARDNIMMSELEDEPYEIPFD
ncbi:hypothetical protein QTV44_002543 [Vibrio vulnificus]|nr:hypothetical protein [Vibrio vulnificus]